MVNTLVASSKVFNFMDAFSLWGRADVDAFIETTMVACFGPLRQSPRPKMMAGAGSGHHVRVDQLTSVERLDPHDRGAVVAANPEHRPRAGLLDKDAADVGGPRQQVL